MPPAPGFWMAGDGRWYPPDDVPEPWRRSRWGFGDVWLGLFAYLIAGIVAVLVVEVVSAATGFDSSIEEPGAYELAVFVAFNAIATVGVVWLATRRKGLQSLRKDFGLDGRWLDPLIGLGAGVCGLIAAGLVGYGIDSAFGADEQSSNLPIDTLDSFGQFAVFFAAVAIVTPVVEELFFRGLVYRSMLKRGRSTWRSIAVTTVVFVVPHLPAAESWVEVASLFGSIGVLGLAFNLACHWTGNRLTAPIVAHLVVNGLAAVALYVT